MDTDGTNIDSGAGEGGRTADPKPVVKDEMAYLIIAAGLAAYAETNDIRILVCLVALYAVGNFAMRIRAQGKL